MAGAPAGERIGLVGHGVRERQVWGPSAVEAEPTAASIVLRRYRCRGCEAVVTVGPRGLLRRRLYTGPAIAIALVLWAQHRIPAPIVRRQVSPWRIVGAAAASSWQSLRRWARAAAGGALWRGLSCATEPSLRQRAARVVALVAATSPSAGDTLSARAFAGAHLVR